VEVIANLAHRQAVQGSLPGPCVEQHGPIKLPRRQSATRAQRTRRSAAPLVNASTRERRSGPWLSGVVVHVALCDQPITAWGPMTGRARTHDVRVLLVTLDAFAADYGSAAA
jgi:hypothetical protein